MKMLHLTILFSLMLLSLCVGWAEAANLTMDRVMDSDMATYRAYKCTSDPACLPNVRVPALDIVQPATGNPIKVIPVTESGRVCYRSMDTVGNESTACSNTIPFRGAVLSAPTGLLQIP